MKKEVYLLNPNSIFNRSKISNLIYHVLITLITNKISNLGSTTNLKRKLLTLLIMTFCLNNIYLQEKLIVINENMSKQEISNIDLAPKYSKNVGNIEGILMHLPNLEGNMSEYRFFKNDFMSQEMQINDPEITTYTGYSVSNKSEFINIVKLGDKINGILMGHSSHHLFEIDNGQYSLKDNKDSLFAQNFTGECGTDHTEFRPFLPAGKRSNTSTVELRKFRLAVVLTTQFVSAFNGEANARFNAMSIISNINAIYGRELSINFIVDFKIESSTIYNINISPLDDIAEEARRSVPRYFSQSNFDLGHVFHIGGAFPAGGYAFSGKAGIGVVCDNQVNAQFKAKGWTQMNPFIMNIFTNVLAHEIGHMFNANHTYNGPCAAQDQFSVRTSYEPGSGTTLMAYAQSCGDSNIKLANGSNAPTSTYFHAGSIDQILAFLSTNTNVCVAPEILTNSPPVITSITSGLQSTIKLPRSTPFELKGQATDPDSDLLTYSWEQLDPGPPHGAINVACSSIMGPIFRSYDPNPNPSRLFPDLQYIINNGNVPSSNIGECLSSVSRSLNFRLTVRDNNPQGGGIAFDSVSIFIDGNIGPMAITSPNTPVNWTGGAKHIVNWTVNRTNEICSSVNLLLSIDGGINFNYIIASNIQNNGSFEVTLPESIPSTNNARIKLESSCSEFIKFFDISNTNFNLITSCPILYKFGICNDKPLVITEGSEALSLNLPKEINRVNTSITLSTAGPRVLVPINLQPSPGQGNCTDSNNINYFSKKLEFIINKSGNYEFEVPSQRIISVFSNLYNPNTPCDNYIGSNSYDNNGMQGGPSSFSTKLTLNLNECQKYTLVLFTQSIVNNTEIKVSGPAGSLFLTSELILPDFDLTYIAIDSISQIIKKIDPLGDFKGLIPGTYKIFGLYYFSGAALLPKKLDLGALLNTKLTDVLSYNACFTISQNYKPLTIIPICPPNTITIDITGPKQSCIDKTVTISANAGTTFKWSTGSDEHQVVVGPGIYRVTVTDENGCSASTGVTISSLPLPNVQISGSLSICQDGETELSGSGGLSYIWSTGSDSNIIKVTPSTSQNYTVTATDTNGCSASKTAFVTVNIPSKPMISGLAQSCEDQTVNLVSSEGLSYIWSTGATTQSIIVTQSDIFDVIVTDENGCINKSTPFEVMFFSPGDSPPPPVKVKNSTCIDCKKVNGSIGAPDFNCPTGYRLQYSVNNKLSWSFDLPVYDEINSSEIFARCSCLLDPNFGGPSSNITTSPQICPEECGCLNFTAEIAGENAVCENDMVTLTVNDGIEFLWNTGETTKSIIVGDGVYRVTVTNISGCVASTSFIVNELSLPNIMINGQKEICKGEFSSLTAEGGIEYQWSNQERTSIVTVEPGNYSVTVTNENGCSSEESVEVIELPLPLVNITGNNTVCISETVELMAVGGVEYLWSNQENTQIVSVVAGTYSVTVTNEIGCSASKDFTISDLPSPSASISGNSLVCQNEVTEIIAQGGIIYKWSNNAETPNIFVTEGFYSVTVTNIDGCTASVSKVIQKSPDPNLEISGINSICEGEVTQLTATGGQFYTWSTGATTSSVNVGPGVYSVTATNEFNCSATLYSSISGKAKPNAMIQGPKSICSGQSATFLASGGISYSWNTGAQTATLTATPSVTTTYTVTVTNSNGCTDIAKLTLKVNSDPVVQASDVRFSAVSRNQMTLHWKNGDGVNRLVVAKANGPVLSKPTNGFNYIANQAFGLGSNIGFGEFVVYNGTDSTTKVTNLIENNTYYFRIFEYGCLKNYLIANANGNPANQIAKCLSPTNQSTTITFSLVSTNQFTANWTNGNGSRRIVKINTINSFTPPPNGTDPSANPKYSGTGQQVVYNGNGSSVTITGLIPNQTYWVRVYEANCDGINSVYNITSTISNPNSQRTRTVLPSVQSFTASNVIFDGNNIIDISSIFTTNKPYDTHPPIDIYVEDNNKTRFTLNASYAAGFSFQLVDQLTIVTDGTMAINPSVYGSLEPVTQTSNSSMYMDYIHPAAVSEEPYLDLKLKLLFEGGLVGMSIPIHIHPSQSPLPVEMSDISVKHNKLADINELTWTTKSEVNNDYFDIERSFEREVFQNIGKVDGMGNSSSSIDYIFNDRNIQYDGTYIYRLKQVDMDGKATTSKLVSVTVSRAPCCQNRFIPQSFHRYHQLLCRCLCRCRSKH